MYRLPLAQQRLELRSFMLREDNGHTRKQRKGEFANGAQREDKEIDVLCAGAYEAGDAWVTVTTSTFVSAAVAW